MKLYYAETGNPRKPCAVAKYLGLPVEYVHIDLSKGENRTPEYLAINPNGKVPALTDGDFMLWESNAIMIYLAQKSDSDLWPTDIKTQVDILRWLHWETAHFSRHGGRLCFEHYIKKSFGLGEPDPDEVTDASKFFDRFARVLDTHLKGRNYLVADRLTVADFGVAAYLPFAEKAQLPLEEFSEINRWHNKLLEIPAWREPFPNS